MFLFSSVIFSDSRFEISEIRRCVTISCLHRSGGSYRRCHRFYSNVNRSMSGWSSTNICKFPKGLHRRRRSTGRCVQSLFLYKRELDLHATARPTVPCNRAFSTQKDKCFWIVRQWRTFLLKSSLTRLWRREWLIKWFCKSFIHTVFQRVSCGCNFCFRCVRDCAMGLTQYSDERHESCHRRVVRGLLSPRR